MSASAPTLPPIDRATLVATRRDLDQQPELGFEERRTSALVAERLRALGYDVRTGVGKTGVVALKGGTGRCVMLRADMDALLFFFSSRRRHTRLQGDWSSDVCSSD